MKILKSRIAIRVKVPNWSLQVYCIRCVTKATWTRSAIKHTFKSMAPRASSQSGHFICVNTVCPANRSMFENCALQGYYTESSGNSLPTFVDNLSVPSLRIKNLLRQIFRSIHSWTSNTYSLSFESLMVVYTNRFKTLELTSCPHCIYLFCIYLRTNSEFCLI